MPNRRVGKTDFVFNRDVLCSGEFSRCRGLVENLIEQYGVYLCVERNLSPHTLRNYLSDLRQFRQFLLAEGFAKDGGGKLPSRK